MTGLFRPGTGNAGGDVPPLANGRHPSTHRSSGGPARRFRRGDECPICSLPDNRCSLNDRGIYLCWNLRSGNTRGDDPGWVFLGVATSGYGGEWGRWKRAERCERCGHEDGRCWQVTTSGQVTIYCANRTAHETTNGWRFLGSTTGRKDGLLRGRWQSVLPASRPIVRKHGPDSAPPTSPTPTAQDQQPPTEDRSAGQDTDAWHTPHGGQANGHGPAGLTVHRWLWEQASPELQGRFVAKLADACITDTSYSRYLSAGAIERIEQLVDEHVRTGVWTDEQVQASGWFVPNKGFGSTLRYRTTLNPGRLIACYDLSGALDQVRANAEVPPVRKKKTRSGKTKIQQIKYQQATGVPTRPYFPRASRELLARLQATGKHYLLQVTEGEDKAECMAQNFASLADGTPVVWVSMAGVWNFAGTEEDLHPELAALLSGASGFGIAYDSDVQSKKEVRQAMARLAERVVEASGGRLVPLAADWRGVMAEYPVLAEPLQGPGRGAKWGLDDLWGALARPPMEGRPYGGPGAGHQDGRETARSVIERLISPVHARMVRRWWQRKGTPWQPDEQGPLLELDEARTEVHRRVRQWFVDGLSPLRSAHSDRLALAATCGAGKTTATMQALVEYIQQWWLAQPDPEEVQQWFTAARAGLDLPCASLCHLSCLLAQWTALVTVAHQILPAPGTLSQAATEVLSLQQHLERLHHKKASSLPDTPERYRLLAEMRSVKEELEDLYHQGIGGPMLFVFKDKTALTDALFDHVVAVTGEIPPWLALRTGREEPIIGVPYREQILPGSLACAHHEAVAALGEQRHSPSAGACQQCIWGQQSTCGFLDSLRVAHQAPVVFATIQAVLNASHELESFGQIVCDEGLAEHLVESMEISKAVRVLLGSIERGRDLGWYTLPPLYTDEQLSSLVAVFGELVAAMTRYHSAPDEEVAARGNRLPDWCDRERLKPHLLRLKDLKPLRWNSDKLEPEGANFFPWERPRYKLGPSGKPLHTETWGEDQQIAFEYIPLRATSDILTDLYQALVEDRPGGYLILERRLVEKGASGSQGEQASTPAGDAAEDATAVDDTAARPAKRERAGAAPLSRRVLLHFSRPHHHLIRALRKRRVLNLDATPNRLLLDAFLPDMRIESIQAAWQHTRILQILTGPMGRATPATMREVLPLVSALSLKGSVLLMSHKKLVDTVDLAAAEHGIDGLLVTQDPKGTPHRMAWYQYHDRAIDDPAWKEADYLVLVGAHRIDLGHSARLAAVVRRFLSVEGRTAPAAPDSPWRVERYGPEGYELVVENGDPLFEGLVEHERTASLIQGLQRPRPVSRTKPLTIVLMRSDPLPAPLNRYVEVVSSIEELVGLSLNMTNKANAARHLEALIRHGETICDWFCKHRTVPGTRQIEEHGKQLWGIGGHRGAKSAMAQAMALWAAKLLPSLVANDSLGTRQPQVLEALAAAAAEHYELASAYPGLPLNEAEREAYWLERYRQGNAQTRLIVWLCTRHLSDDLKQAMEEFRPLAAVISELRASILRRQQTTNPDQRGP